MSHDVAIPYDVCSNPNTQYFQNFQLSIKLPQKRILGWIWHEPVIWEHDVAKYTNSCTWSPNHGNYLKFFRLLVSSPKIKLSQNRREMESWQILWLLGPLGGPSDFRLLVSSPKIKLSQNRPEMESWQILWLLGPFGWKLTICFEILIFRLFCEFFFPNSTI